MNRGGRFILQSLTMPMTSGLLGGADWPLGSRADTAVVLCALECSPTRGSSRRAKMSPKTIVYSTRGCDRRRVPHAACAGTQRFKGQLLRPSPFNLPPTRARSQLGLSRVSAKAVAAHDLVGGYCSQRGHDYHGTNLAPICYRKKQRERIRRKGEGNYWCLERTFMIDFV
ncbi:hypothetical protein BKA62DRAFT_169388 [Auriculariales sp. MPI-PUGE-AT-0066]|nr:hypothetical protein BKA62DRAFT_169388 [Auriculariales sp. MPI-PUGE-AT-0066]